MTDAHYIDHFKQVFGNPPTVISHAPGRVNLIGEHVDYNDGLVLPFAISQRVVVTGAAEDSSTLTVHSHATGEQVRFSLENVAPGPRGAWENYIRGMVAGLQAEGTVLRGARLCIDGDLPAGRGLSSSAALCVAVGQALAALAGENIAPTRMAQIAREAEHRFAGMPCGIMDPYAVCHARRGHALLVDCRDLSHTHIALDPRGCRFVLIPSGVQHALVDGAYESRVRACRAAVDILSRRDPAVRSLRDATLEMLDAAQGELGPVYSKRARHVVTELDRVRQMVEALRASDWLGAGALLWRTQNSLRDDYEVSCPEVDEIVAVLRGKTGVYGARMVGGGFGGMILALVEESAMDAVAAALRQHGEADGKPIPELTPVVPGDGAGCVMLAAS